MTDETQQPKELTDILGIKWPVETGFGQVDRPSITVERVEKVHRVTLPMSYSRMPQAYWGPDLVHEYIHAAMAEQIDPIFSTIYFDRGIDTNNPTTRQKMQQVYYAQQLVDVWVADRMRGLDRSLVEQDISSWLDLVKRADDAQLERIPLETMLGWALNKADVVRGGFRDYDSDLKQVLGKTGKIWGRDAKKMTAKLGSMYTVLPKLSNTREEALEQFESAVSKAAGILGFEGLNPRMKQVEEGVVWVFE